MTDLNNRRLRWFERETGSEYIAERDHEGSWIFSEREWGGVCWYEVRSTPKLVKKALIMVQSAGLPPK